MWTDQDRQVLGQRLRALIAASAPAAIVAGHPYPGQRYRHGWIPVAGFNPKAYAQRRHADGRVELGHRSGGKVTGIGSAHRGTSGQHIATHANGSTSSHRSEAEARSAVIRGHMARTSETPTTPGSRYGVHGQHASDEALPVAKKALADFHPPDLNNYNVLDYRKQHLDPHWTFTNEQRDAIDRYTNNTYRDVNHALRDGKTHPDVAAIDSAMKPLPGDLTLLRSLPINDAVRPLLSAKPGTVFRDKSYSSTTLIPERYGANLPDNVVFRIRAPKGTKALWARQASDHPTENEVILPHGQRYAVLKVTENPHFTEHKSYTIDVLALPDEGQGRGEAAGGAHGGLPAGDRATQARQFVKTSGIANWEQTKPWDRPQADFAAGKVPGFQMPTGAARGFSARWEGDHINLNPATFDGSSSSSRRSLFYHEAGHGVAEQVTRTVKDVGPLLEPFRHGSNFVSPFGGVKGEHGHADNPSEILADAYAALMDGTAGRYRQPGTDKLFSTVQDAAKRLGYPTGDRNAAPKIGHEEWRQTAPDTHVRRPGGDYIQVRQAGPSKFAWSVTTDRGTLATGTSRTRAAAQRAADAAHLKKSGAQ